MRPEASKPAGAQTTDTPVSPVETQKDPSGFKLLFISGWQSTKAAFRSAGKNISGAVSRLGKLLGRLTHNLRQLTEKTDSAKGHVQNQPLQPKGLTHIQAARESKKDPTATIPINRLSLGDVETKMEFELFVKSEQKADTPARPKKQKDAVSETLEPDNKYAFEPMMNTARPGVSENAASNSEPQLFAGLIAQFSALRHIDMPDILPGSPEKNYGVVSQKDTADIQKWLKKSASETTPNQSTNIPGFHKLARAMSAEFLNGLTYEERLRIVVTDFGVAAKNARREPPADLPTSY